MSPEERVKEDIGAEVSKQTAKKIGKVVGIVGAIFAGIFFILLFGFLFGWVIKFLWNYAMVAMFGLPEISYWQGVAIFVLAKIFFGFGHSGGRHRHGHKRRDEKESERVRHWWRHHRRMESPDKSTFKEYWEAEGKAAYEAYLTARGSQTDHPEVKRDTGA